MARVLLANAAPGPAMNLANASFDGATMVMSVALDKASTTAGICPRMVVRLDSSGVEPSKSTKDGEPTQRQRPTRSAREF